MTKTMTQPHPVWHAADGVRIWRAPDSSFHGNELEQAADVYTADVLKAISQEGFNGVWLRGKLHRLMDQSVFPSLNEPEAAGYRRDLRAVIERGRRCGVQLYLFFNEPLALRADDPFWQQHPDVAGQPHRDYGEDFDRVALCTSHPKVQQFMREAIASVLDDLPGLGGVILITASEHHAHCWSHQVIRPLNDGCTQVATAPLQCNRCRDRGAAEVVAELITIWRDVAADRPSPVRVLCWNWSWSMWYPDPQTQVYERLPDGVGVILDFERGMQVQRLGRLIDIDEYSLSVTGPSDRFVSSKAVATARGLPVYAKLQLGTTHEIATVPNLPLMEQLHGKLLALSNEHASGFMGTWCFGCSRTLNTAAVGFYASDPDRYADRDTFLQQLAIKYFGEVDSDEILSAWQKFGQAFSHYPFSIRFLYWSIINCAPAYPLSTRYEARPLGGAWVRHEWGDRLEDSLDAPMDLAGIAEALHAVADGWESGLISYARALLPNTDNPVLQSHRREELSCATMIGLQIRCAANIYHFGAWRQEQMQQSDLTPPCDLTLDDEAIAILQHQRTLATAAARLCRHDPRLGFHQEDQAAFYDEASIRANIRHLDRILPAQ